MENRMQLWNLVSETNPAITKEVNQRGGFTAICAQSQLKRATEMFGPFGIGFYVIDEAFTFQPSVGIAMYQATFNYIYNQKEGVIPLHSSMVYVKKDRVDEDFAKKLATDALTKGLSKLGFNSDIFEGKFDDSKYVKDLKAKYAKKGEGDLPEMTPSEKVKMGNIYQELVEANEKFASMDRSTFANIIFLTIGKWPNTEEDLQKIRNEVKVE